MTEAKMSKNEEYQLFVHIHEGAELLEPSVWQGLSNEQQVEVLSLLEASEYGQAVTIFNSLVTKLAVSVKSKAFHE